METHFVKNGNAFYEIDEECLRKSEEEHRRMEDKVQVKGEIGKTKIRERQKGTSGMGRESKQR